MAKSFKDIKIASVFNTIQGEGRCAGEYVTFIRLFTEQCFPDFFERKRCKFCDTVYNKTLYRDHLTPDDLQNKDISRHVVITGGEPFSLDMKQLHDFILHIKKKYHVEKVDIETNGSYLTNKIINKMTWRWFNRIMEEVNVVSISPKLVNSYNVLNEETFVHDYDYDFLFALQTSSFNLPEKKNDVGKFDFKFVVGAGMSWDMPSDTQLDEIDDFVNRSMIPKTNIYLMAMTPSTRKFQMMLANAAINKRWNYSPRLHIDLWGVNTDTER